jgi:hypothetical protein
MPQAVPRRTAAQVTPPTAAYTLRAMTDRATFSSGDVLLIADDLVAEAFAFQSSLRVPVARLGIRTRPDKHGQVNVQFGYLNAPDSPRYGPDANISPGSTGFTLPAADEPRLRAFFDSIPASPT